MYDDLSALNNSINEEVSVELPSKKTVLEVNDFKILFEKEKYNIRTSFGSFDVKEGDFLLLKGRNGSGKSTFLKYVTNNFVEGIYSKVNGGNITYITKNNEKICPHNTTKENVALLRRQIAEVSQFDDNQSSMSAYDVLKDKALSAIKYTKGLNATHREAYEQGIDMWIDKIFCGLDLDGVTFKLSSILGNASKKEFRRKKISNYSGGQQKLVNVLAGLLKALIMGTNLMLLDEPLNNLDGKNKFYVNELVKFVRRKNPKMAIVMISHCHIFEGINKVVDVDNGPEEHTYIARLIDRETANEVDKLKFIPHSDCIEDCGNKR